MKLSVLILLLLTVGCSKDEKKSDSKDAKEANPQGMMVADEASLPDCTNASEDFLVYVQSASSFHTCKDKTWTPIDLKGAAGEKGDAGEKGIDSESAKTFTKGIALFEKYRKSVYKIRLTCELDASKKNKDDIQCDNSGLAYPTETTFSGSGFLCAKNKVCSNAHVVSCIDVCYNMSEVSIQSVEGESTSVNSDSSKDTGTSPFFITNSSADIKIVNSAGDLAKITVTDAPSDAVLPLSEDAYTKSVTNLMTILSMSFPLGFQDLHIDLGEVVVANLTHCTGNSSSLDKYFCPAAYYDFSTSNDTDHGSSGSPLIDIESGMVVGLTSAGTIEENANYTWAIDANRLNDIP
jgi:hypothetical protein